jgi:hypothetical protein
VKALERNCGQDDQQGASSHTALSHLGELVEASDPSRLVKCRLQLLFDCGPASLPLETLNNQQH